KKTNAGGQGCREETKSRAGRWTRAVGRAGAAVKLTAGRSTETGWVGASTSRCRRVGVRESGRGHDGGVVGGKRLLFDAGLGSRHSLVVAEAPPAGSQRGQQARL